MLKGEDDVGDINIYPSAGNMFTGVICEFEDEE